LQYLGETHSTPPGIADAAVGPLKTGNGRIDEAAAVTGAFNYGYHLDGRKLFQIVHGQGERRRDVAVDAEVPVVQIDRGHVDVRAHEEVVDGSDVIGETGKGHFQ